MSVIIGLSFAIACLLLISFSNYPPINFESKNQIKPKSVRIAKEFSAEVWADVVDDLTSALRAGLSLPQAIIHISNSGPGEVKDVFALAMQRYQMTGDFSGSLNLLSDVFDDAIADKFVSGIQIAYEVGGTDLGLLLRTLSEVIREESKLRGEIDARQSWTVNGAKLAISAPWITVLILSTRESALSVYLSVEGLRLLAFCAVVTLIAYFGMLQIGKLPSSIRVRS